MHFQDIFLPFLILNICYQDPNILLLVRSCLKFSVQCVKLPPDCGPVRISVFTREGFQNLGKIDDVLYGWPLREFGSSQGSSDTHISGTSQHHLID